MYLGYDESHTVQSVSALRDIVSRPSESVVKNHLFRSYYLRKYLQNENVGDQKGVHEIWGIIRDYVLPTQQYCIILYDITVQPGNISSKMSHTRSMVTLQFWWDQVLNNLTFEYGGNQTTIVARDRIRYWMPIDDQQKWTRLPFDSNPNEAVKFPAASGQHASLCRSQFLCNRDLNAIKFLLHEIYVKQLNGSFTAHQTWKKKDILMFNVKTGKYQKKNVCEISDWGNFENMVAFSKLKTKLQQRIDKWHSHHFEQTLSICKEHHFIYQMVKSVDYPPYVVEGSCSVCKVDTWIQFPKIHHMWASLSP